MAIHKAVPKATAELNTVEQAMLGFRQQIDQSMGILDNLAQVEAQFSDLAQLYQTLRTTIRQVQDDSRQMAELEQRLLALDGALQRLRADFTTFQGDCENPREAVQIYIDNLETRLRTELRAALNRLEQSGFGPAQIEKVDKVDTLVRGLKASARETERRLQLMQSWLVASSLVAIVALGLPLLTPFIQGTPSGTSPLTETEETPAVPEAPRQP